MTVNQSMRFACVDRFTCEWCGRDFLFRHIEPSFDEEEGWDPPDGIVPACTSCMRSWQASGTVKAGPLSRNYVHRRTERRYGFTPIWWREKQLPDGKQGAE